MTRIFLLSLAILISTFANAQNDEHHVMMQYPEIYQSINSYIDQNVRGAQNAQTKQAHYSAFLDIAESNDQYQDDAMTSAILKWSLKNETAYNRSIIDDENIDNPFAFLRCNWVGVKSEYYKSVNPVAANYSVQQAYTPIESSNVATYEYRQPRDNYGSTRQPIPATSLKEYSNYNQSAAPAYSGTRQGNYGQQQNYGSTRQPIPATSLKEYSNYGQQNYNYNNNQQSNYKVKQNPKDKSNYRQHYSEQYKQVYSDQYQKEMEIVNAPGVNQLGDGYYYDNSNSYNNNNDAISYPDSFQPANEPEVSSYPRQRYRKNESTTRYDNRRRTAPQDQQQYEVVPQQTQSEAAPQFYRKDR